MSISCIFCLKMWDSNEISSALISYIHLLGQLFAINDELLILTIGYEFVI